MLHFSRLLQSYGATSLLEVTHVRCLQFLWRTNLVKFSQSQTAGHLHCGQALGQKYACINVKRTDRCFFIPSGDLLPLVKEVDNIKCSYSPIKKSYLTTATVVKIRTYATTPFAIVVSRTKYIPSFSQLYRCSAPRVTSGQDNRKMIRTHSSQSSVDISSLLERLQGLEDSLRYKGYSTIRIAMAFAFVIGFAIYLFRESLRDNVAGEVSHVASRSLEDEMVIGKVEEFAKSLLKTIGHDDNMQRMAADFVRQVMQREESKDAVKQLLLSVLNDPNTRKKLGQTFQEVIMEAVSDQSTLTALKSAVHDIVGDDGTKEVLRELLRSVFAQEEVVTLTSGFFKEVIKSDPVVHQATTLGKQVTQNVIGDPAIQMATSNTIWRAVKLSLTPKWLSGQDKLETKTENGPSES